MPRLCIVCCEIALAISGAADAKDCRIKGDDVLKEARANGFRFEARINGGDGTCSFKDGRFLAIASLSAPQPAGSAVSATANTNISCAGIGFADRRISTLWKLKSMSIVGGTFTFQSPPRNGTDDLTFSIVYESPPGAPIVLGIDYLILEGTDCNDWRRAFTEARPR